MTQPAESKRFRVALSFPGEHRARVERIAWTLTDSLDRERILYDRSYAAEFAQPDLDVYLTDLYHDQSDPSSSSFFAGSTAKKSGTAWNGARSAIS